MATADPVARFERHYGELRVQRQRLILCAPVLLALAVSDAVRQFLPEKRANGLPRIGYYLYDTLPVLRAHLLFADSRTDGVTATRSAGALGKMFSEVYENASDRPIEDVRAAGGIWFDEMLFGVLPQVWPNFLSYIWLRLKIAIRGASMIGFVGGGSIGQELHYVSGFNHYEEVSAIVLTVTAVDLISERLRHRAIGRKNLA